MRRVDAPLQILNRCFCPSIFTPPTAPRCIVWHIHEFVSVFLCSISRLLFYPSPACLPAYLRIKLKKESCLFSASFIPSFSFHSWTSAAPSAISSAQATFFFLCFLMQPQTSDLEWPAVSVTVKKKEKQRENAFWWRFWISNQHRQLQPCPSVENLRRGSFDYHAWSVTSCLLVLPVMSHAVLLWFIYCLMDYGRSSQLRWSHRLCIFILGDSNEQFY